MVLYIYCTHFISVLFIYKTITYLCINSIQSKSHFLIIHFVLILLSFHSLSLYKSMLHQNLFHILFHWKLFAYKIVWRMKNVFKQQMRAITVPPNNIVRCVRAVHICASLYVDNKIQNCTSMYIWKCTLCKILDNKIRIE